MNSLINDLNNFICAIEHKENAGVKFVAPIYYQFQREYPQYRSESFASVRKAYHAFRNVCRYLFTNNLKSCAFCFVSCAFCFLSRAFCFSQKIYSIVLWTQNPHIIFHFFSEILETDKNSLSVRIIANNQLVKGSSVWHTSF
jgi:hypothetical protein